MDPSIMPWAQATMSSEATSMFMAPGAQRALQARKHREVGERGCVS